MDSSKHFLPQQSQTSPSPSSYFQSPPDYSPSSYDFVKATVAYPFEDYVQTPTFSPAVFSRTTSSQPLAKPQPPRSRSSSASSSHSRRDGSTSPRVQPSSPPGRRSEIPIKSDSPDVAANEELKGDDSPVTCDFARKLYRLLEDPSLSHILCWGPGGDFFVIKDVNAFTINILPRSFKHSNYASFVRQLNKYDFHKTVTQRLLFHDQATEQTAVHLCLQRLASACASRSVHPLTPSPQIKTGDDNQFGENSWLFRHRNFRAGGLDALENIKRKVPATRKSTRSTPPPSPAAARALEGIRAQVEHMAQRQSEMTTYIQNMESEYVSVVNGMVNLQRNFAQQDGTMRQLVGYALQYEDGGMTP